MKKVLISLLCLIALGSLGANAYLYQKYSTRRPILKFADGAGVSVKEFRDELEFRHGRQVLRKMTLAKIVRDAAKKAGALPTEADIDARIAELEKSSPEAIQTAKATSGGAEDVRNDLSVELALENIGIQNVKVSESEVRKFYQAHPELFKLPRQSRVSFIVADTAVDAGAAAKMLVHPETTEAMLAMESGLHVVGLNGFQPNLDALPAEMKHRLRQTALGLAPGKVAQLELGQTHVVLRGEKQQPAGVMPFDAAKSRAARLARLLKARPRDETLANLFEKANVTFEMDYREWFRDLTDRERPETQTASR